MFCVSYRTPVPPPWTWPWTWSRVAALGGRLSLGRWAVELAAGTETGTERVERRVFRRGRGRGGSWRMREKSAPVRLSCPGRRPSCSALPIATSVHTFHAICCHVVFLCIIVAELLSFHTPSGCGLLVQVRCCVAFRLGSFATRTRPRMVLRSNDPSYPRKQARVCEHMRKCADQLR